MTKKVKFEFKKSLIGFLKLTKKKILLTLLIFLFIWMLIFRLLFFIPLFYNIKSSLNYFLLVTLISLSFAYILSHLILEIKNKTLRIITIILLIAIYLIVFIMLLPRFY